MHGRFAKVAPLLALAALLAGAAGPAGAQSPGRQPAAEVTELRGVVEALSTAGVERDLSSGDALFSGETIRTARRASVSLEFADGTHFELGPDAEMEVEEFAYARREDDRLTTRVVKGVFRFVSGLLSKARPNSMRVQLSATASIGVRGTNVVGRMDGEEATVILMEGEGGEPTGAVMVSNEHGSVTIEEAGFGTVVPDAASPPSPPRRMQLNAIQNLMRSLSTIGRIGAPRPRVRP